VYSRTYRPSIGRLAIYRDAEREAALTNSYKKENRQYSPRATLAALGLKLNSLKLLDPIKYKVVVLQKASATHRFENWLMPLLRFCLGARGLAEINTRVRSDNALQRAFGIKACADQSVVQETLNACTKPNVRQMQKALDVIFRKHSLACRHNYKECLQLQ